MILSIEELAVTPGLRLAELSTILLQTVNGSLAYRSSLDMQSDIVERIFITTSSRRLRINKDLYSMLPGAFQWLAVSSFGQVRLLLERICSSSELSVRTRRTHCSKISREKGQDRPRSF